jgi:hypothetical protein
MTALDTSTVVAGRRDALDRLDRLREQIAGFLDHPTAAGLSRLTSTVQEFVQFESADVLGGAALDELSLDQVEGLANGHHALASHVNLLSWAVPGSADAQTGVHQLRHEVLAHIARYHALRLPRGTIISSP